MISVLEYAALAEGVLESPHGTFSIYIGKVEVHKDGAEVHITWSVRHNTHTAEQTFILERHDPFLQSCEGGAAEVVARKLVDQAEVEYDQHNNETLISLGFDGNMLHPRAFCWNQENQFFDQRPY
jgi:hypothetical protein